MKEDAQSSRMAAGSPVEAREAGWGRRMRMVDIDDRINAGLSTDDEREWAAAGRTSLSDTARVQSQ